MATHDGEFIHCTPDEEAAVATTIGARAGGRGPGTRRWAVIMMGAGTDGVRTRAELTGEWRTVRGAVGEASDALSRNAVVYAVGEWEGIEYRALAARYVCASERARSEGQRARGADPDAGWRTVELLKESE
jgi:hypothetical protein